MSWCWLRAELMCACIAVMHFWSPVELVAQVVQCFYGLAQFSLQFHKQRYGLLTRNDLGHVLDWVRAV